MVFQSKQKAVMFDANIVVLHQVLNETSQQIVSGKDSPVIKTNSSFCHLTEAKGMLFKMHAFINMLWQLYKNRLIICRKTQVMKCHKSSFSTLALRKCAMRQKKAIRTKIYHLYQHLQSQRSRARFALCSLRGITLNINNMS